MQSRRPLGPEAGRHAGDCAPGDHPPCRPCRAGGQDHRAGVRVALVGRAPRCRRPSCRSADRRAPLNRARASAVELCTDDETGTMNRHRFAVEPTPHTQQPFGCPVCVIVRAFELNT